VRESKEWNPDQKKELRQFLGVQAASWKLLGDEYWKTELGQAKETMLFSTWRKFTKGMGSATPGRKAMSKVVVTTIKSPTTNASTKRNKITKSDIRKRRQRNAALKKAAEEKRAGKTTVGKVTMPNKKTPGEASATKVEGKKKLKDVTLERESSTSGTIVQADVKTIKGGIETPIGSKKVVGQTVVHLKSKSSVSDKAGKKDVRHK